MKRALLAKGLGVGRAPSGRGVGSWGVRRTKHSAAIGPGLTGGPVQPRPPLSHPGTQVAVVVAESGPPDPPLGRLGPLHGPGRATRHPPCFSGSVSCECAANFSERGLAGFGRLTTPRFAYITGLGGVDCCQVTINNTTILWLWLLAVLACGRSVGGSSVAASSTASV